MIRFTVFPMLASVLCGQTLEIPAVRADRGRPNIIRILLKPRTDQPLTALQWELVTPPGWLVDASEIVPGGAASSAEKSLTCSSRTDPKDGRVYLCILAGSQQVLPEGVIAIVKFTATAAAHTGQVMAHVRKVQGVSKDLKSVPIPNADVSVTIR